MPVLASPPLPRGPLSGVGTVGGWRITSYFGGRIDPITGRAGNHGGQDIAGAGINGVPLLAVVDGPLVQAWDRSGGGNWSMLTSAATGDAYGYGHAAGFAHGGRARTVKAGEVIGWVGSTGKSTGAHLHFAYRPAGTRTYADPWPLLEHAEILVVPAPARLPDPPATFATVPFSATQETDPMTPTYKLSDGSFYACDGIEARWLYGDAYIGLTFGETPACAKAVALDRNTSVDFLRSFEGSLNIPTGSADAYAKANP